MNDLVADWKDEICDEFEGIETTENIEFFAENEIGRASCRERV